MFVNGTEEPSRERIVAHQSFEFTLEGKQAQREAAGSVTRE
jgi:hypothetical protein